MLYQIPNMTLISVLGSFGGMGVSFVVSLGVGWGDVWLTNNPVVDPRVFMLWLFVTGPALIMIYLLALAFRRKGRTEIEPESGTDNVGFPVLTRRRFTLTVTELVAGRNS
ncbi:MAG: hypothetical protein AAGA55_11145 [Planctomycetota bacterium]